MWHHKSKLGTFWIVESEDHLYHLGIDEESLGIYRRIEEAIQVIRAQETGHLKWDLAQRAEIPEDVHEWVEGEPENWNSTKL